MRSVAQSLEAGVTDVRADLELADVLTAALEQRFEKDPESLRKYVQRARRATYANTIVSCYGLIEQTVDHLLMAIAEAYNRFLPTHGDLPEPVRSAHREVLLQCLRDGDRARTRRQVSEKDALRALGLNAPDVPKLVPPAFTLSTANYRSPYVTNLFARLGIDVEKQLYHGRADAALARAGFADYESFLEDLVQRRNDLAHSFRDDGEIIDRQLLDAYVEIAACWLLDLVRLANVFAIRTMRDWLIEPVGLVDKQWTGRIGIGIEVDSIRVGDQILLFKGDWCTSHRVESLQSAGIDGEKFVFSGRVMQVGARLDCVPTGAANAEVFVLPEDLSEFWPGVHKWGYEVAP